MKAPSTKLINISEVYVDLSLNSRLDYHVQPLKENILAVGRITDPISVEPYDKVDGYKWRALKGNRRTLAGTEIVKDPQSPVSVVEQMKKVQAVVYTDLTDRERISLIFDQGQQRGLGREETVQAVWRLSRQMFSEREIANQLMFCLAGYTGSLRKVDEIASITNATDREKATAKWLHGTLGNFILRALDFSEEVQQAFLLTERELDKGKLSDEDTAKRSFKMSRDRMKQLSEAKSASDKDETWDPATKSSPRVKELIAKFKDEDTNGKETSTRMSDKALRERAGQMQSQALGQALKVAVGDLKGEVVEKLDAEMARVEKIMELAKKACSKLDVKDKKATYSPADLSVILSAILYASPEAAEKAITSVVK